MCVCAFPAPYPSESNRIEIKKFQEAKAPLSGLKFKMQVKASTNDSYQVFSDELQKVIEEQSKFLNNVEYEVALAEAVDPVQARFF
jgi:hypothetical protein